MKKVKFFILTVIFLQLYAFTFGIDFYVALTGNDAYNPGTSSQPFATISRAQEYIRLSEAPGMINDINVYIGPGTYYLDAPLLFTTEDSGRDEHRIIYRALTTGDWPVLCYGEKISGWSTDATTGISSAEIETSSANVLYENNIRGIRRTSIAALTDPGCFYIESGYLYYKTRNTPVEDQDIILPLGDNLITLQGNSVSDSVRNITFSGIVFSASNYNPNRNTLPGNETGLFCIENGIGITLSQCKILNAGNTGVLVTKGGQNITLSNNRIDGFGTNGISFSGLTIGDSGYNLPVNSYINKNNSITNNLVTDGAGVAGECAGIRLYQSGNNTITYNAITRLYGSGIRIHGLSDPAHTKDNRIEYNRISLLQADSPAAGGIYATRTGSNNLYNNNIITALLNINSQYAISGINLAENAGYGKITNNIISDVHDIPGASRPVYIAAPGIEILNNVIAYNDPLHDIVYDNRTGKSGSITCMQNIFYTPGGYYYHYFLERNAPGLSSSVKNLVFHPGGEYFIKLPPNKLKFETWNSSMGYDAGTLIRRDPFFQEPGSGLFRVTAASPALGQDLKFTNINIAVCGPGADFPLKHATDRIEAEKYNTEQPAVNGETTARLAGTGNFLRFSGVFFPPHLKFVNIRFSTGSAEESDLNTTLEIRSNGTSGTLLGSSPVKGTGGFGKYALYSIAVTPPAGTYNLYFLLSGEGAPLQVDWFEFSGIKKSELPDIPQPPVVEIISPASGSLVLAGDSLLIQAEAMDEDKDGSVSRMEIFINDTPLFMDSNNTIKYNWTSSVAGDYTIKVTATDNQGAVGSSSVVITVTSRIPGPEIKIIKPLEGASMKGPVNLEILAEVKDRTSPITLVEFYANGILLFVDPESPYRCVWENAYPGEHVIMVKATNQKGFTTYSSVNILINNEQYILGHWTFDAFSGALAADVSGNEHHARIEKAYTVRGVNGNAMEFQGDGGLMTDFPLLNDLQQFTMAGWLNIRNPGFRIGLWGQDGVVEFGFINNTILQLWTLQGGMLEVLYPYKTGEWHHITAMGAGYVLKIYLDGQLAYSIEKPTMYYGASEGSFNIGGGGIFDPEGNGLDGMIDDVIVYSKAITDTEVKLLARRQNNLLPSVKITYPVTGSQLNGPCNIRIKVDASDKDSGIKLIEYYANEQLIGSSDTAPYDYSWVGVPPQNYTLTVKAIDNDEGVATNTIYFSVILPGDTLLGYWNFNDNSNTIAYDQSVNNNHGEIHNGTLIKGISGNAISFTGDGDIITKHGLINNLTSFTLAGWIKPEAIGWRTGLWGQDEVVEFGFSEEPTILLWTLKGGSVSTTYPFNLNEWHHIAAVGTGSSLKIYLDGKAAVTYNQKTSNYGSTPWTFNMAGGGIYDSHGNNFTGAIDEVYAYKKALSDDEILALANINAADKPQIILTGIASGSTIYYPFLLTFQTEITNNDCAVKVVQFSINQDVVSEDTEAPYEYVWEINEEPPQRSFRITAKLITECGFWDDDTITISVASTEELKAQYAESLAANKKENENNESGTGDSQQRNYNLKPLDPNRKTNLVYTLPDKNKVGTNKEQKTGDKPVQSVRSLSPGGPQSTNAPAPLFLTEKQGIKPGTSRSAEPMQANAEENYLSTSLPDESGVKTSPGINSNKDPGSIITLGGIMLAGQKITGVPAWIQTTGLLIVVILLAASILGSIILIATKKSAHY